MTGAAVGRGVLCRGRVYDVAVLVYDSGRRVTVVESAWPAGVGPGSVDADLSVWPRPDWKAADAMFAARVADLAGSGHVVGPEQQLGPERARDALDAVQRFFAAQRLT